MVASIERNEGCRKLRVLVGRGNPNANGKHQTLMAAVSAGDTVMTGLFVGILLALTLSGVMGQHFG